MSAGGNRGAPTRQPLPGRNPAARRRKIDLHVKSDQHVLSHRPIVAQALPTRGQRSVAALRRGAGACAIPVRETLLEAA
jgi:hypothetical protein